MQDGPKQLVGTLTCTELVTWAEARLGAALDARKHAVLLEQEIDGRALLLVSREELVRIGLPLGFAAILKDAAEREVVLRAQSQSTPPPSAPRDKQETTHHSTKWWSSSSPGKNAAAVQ